MSDEVREFHLDGKQLAFLVISAIGVSVVVFLCGVMVGRGVRGLSAGERVEAASSAQIAPSSDTGVSGADVPVATDGRIAKEKTSPIPNENLSYPRLLSTPTPEAPSAPLPAPKATPAAPTTAARAPASATPATKEAPRGRLYVQVSSVKERSGAENIKRQLEGKPYLQGKSYKASVSEAVVQGHTMFRVLVGPFDARPEATAVNERVHKDFKGSIVVAPR